MASPTSGLGHRVAPHSSPNYAAIQGAAIAFQANTQRHSTSPDSLNPTLAREKDVIDKSQSGQELVSQSHPPQVSETPPEVGSVKDKIGRFATTFGSSTVQIPSNTSSQSQAITATHPPQQSAPGMVAKQKPPIPSRKPTAIISNSLSQDAKKSRSEHDPDKNDISIVKLEPRSRATATNVLPPEPSSNEKHLPSKATKDEPIPQTSATVSASLGSTQLATIKPRPLPPTPRKASTTVPTPAVTNTVPEDTKSFIEVTTPSTRSSTAAERQHMSVPGQSPALPPRSNTLPMASRDPKSLRAVLDEAKSLHQVASPNIPSAHRQSHNSSSSSLVNEYHGMNGEALSDAIVASSLASSRASSTKRTPPPPPPQRRPGGRSDLRQTVQVRSTSPLRRTLRNTTMSEEESRQDHRHRRHLIHKHPHKHHEGDRKRWRSEITERARKRYEGVWAANKGLCVPTQEEIDQFLSMQRDSSIRIQYPPNASEMVANVVVRDIWSRSHLQGRILEQIWDLVDHQNIGLLTREEFVVGMWLIDQQLKGHKLPAQVPKSVWDSVKRVSGISLKDITFSA